MVIPCRTPIGFWGSTSRAPSAWVCVSMKPGATVEPGRLDDVAGLRPGQVSDGGDHLAGDADVTPVTGVTGAVDDRPSPDHEIEHADSLSAMQTRRFPGVARGSRNRRRERYCVADRGAVKARALLHSEWSPGRRRA